MTLEEAFQFAEAKEAGKRSCSRLVDLTDNDNECHDSNRCTKDIVCTMNMHHFTVPLEHHVYDTLTDTWVRRNSKPQPYINVDIQTFSQDNGELGLDDLYESRHENI